MNSNIFGITSIGLELKENLPKTSIALETDKVEEESEFLVKADQGLGQRFFYLISLLLKVQTKYIFAIFSITLSSYIFFSREPINKVLPNLEGKFYAETWDGEIWKVAITENGYVSFEHTIKDKISLFLAQNFEEDINYTQTSQKLTFACVAYKDVKELTCDSFKMDDFTRIFALLPVLGSGTNIALKKASDIIVSTDNSLISYNDLSSKIELTLNIENNKVNKALFTNEGQQFTITGTEGSSLDLYDNLSLEATETLISSIKNGVMNPNIPLGLPAEYKTVNIGVPKLLFICDMWNLFPPCSLKINR